MGSYMKKLLFLFVVVLSLPHFLHCTDKKLRILFLINKFPHASRQYINNMITGLLDEGHEVFILAQQQGPVVEYPEVEQYDLLNKTFYQEMPKHLKTFDILFCQFAGLSTLDVMQNQGLQGKLVICLRGADGSSDLQKKPYRYKQLFNQADLFLPVCNNFRNKIVALGCDPNKAIVHHSAIDCNQFQYKKRVKPTDGKIKIVTVARLVEMKGLCYSLRAIAKLVKRYPAIRYEIIGDGEQRASLELMIKELHVQDHVKIVGYLPHAQVLKKLYQSHIALLSSVTTDQGEQEGIPNVLMEAMATGLPVVATRHSGISELVQDGVTGFLVAEKDVDGLADRIAYLIEHSELWAPMGKAGSSYVKKEHNKKIANKRLITIFKQLLAM